MHGDHELHASAGESKSGHPTESAGVIDPPEPAGPDLAQRLAEGIARGAAVVAGLTILSRILGLVRTLVFSQTVGASCLGTAYVTANQVPDLLYQLILGGALTSAMVPVLARSAERASQDPAEKARVSQITSALLTWTVVIVVPLVVAIVAVAGPVASLLNPSNPNAHCVRADVVTTTGYMLQVFAPQALLYGLSVVLYGLLQSYRRFAAPSIGPGISSLVLIACYLAFVPLNKGRPLARLPLTAELVLSVGTTLGIAVLVVVALPPTRRLHLRFRPALRFPPGVARRAGGLALVGVAELVAIDVANVVTIDLANGHGQTGAHRLVQLRRAGVQLHRRDLGPVHRGQRVPGAVRAGGAGLRPDQRRVDPGGPADVVAGHGGDRGDRRSRRSCAGQAARSGLAADLDLRVVRAGHRGHRGDREPVPGDVRHRAAQGGRRGAGRKLADHDRADLVLVQLVPARLVPAMLALGTTIGQTVVAIPVMFVTRRICGPAAVQGTRHAALAGLVACAAGAAVGVAVSLAVPLHHKLVAVAVAVPAAGCAIVAYGVVAYFLDDGDFKAVLAWLRRALAKLRS